MEMKKIQELEEKYDLELKKVVKSIIDSKARVVLLQFADGLKPYATDVVDFLEEKEELKDVDFLIWFGSCYGACDTPVGLEKLNPKIDLVVQFGHSELLPSY